MPHYRDGRPAQVGDLVMDVNEDHGSRPMGLLVSIGASSSCNGQMLTLARKHGHLPWVRDFSPYTDFVTLSDLLPVEAIDRHNSSELIEDLLVPHN